MPREDKATRNIRTQMKNVFGKVPNYAKGVGGLLAASGKEFFNLQMPTPAAFYETNEELIRDTARFLRNPVDALNKSINRAMGTDDFKALEKFGKYMIDDLKTGKLYDKDRDRTSFGDSVDDLLNEFGGFDMTGFDEEGNYNEPEGMDPSIATDISIAEMQESNADARAEATIGAIAKSTEAQITSDKANTQLNLRVGMKQHQQTLTAMNNILTTQTATFEALHRGVEAQLQVTKEAHTQVLSELTDMKKILGEIRDNTAPKVDKGREYKEQESVFGDNGIFDIKRYAKRVVKNIDEKFNISSMVGAATMGMSVSELLELNQSNPWQMVTDKIIEKMVGPEITKQMQRTDRNMKNFLPALLQKFSQRGEMFASGESEKTIDAILGVLGIKDRSRKYIETANSNLTAPATITTKFVKSVEEVIPMWLARIDSHISGEPLMMYNYQSGKLVKVANVVAEYERKARDLAGKLGEAGSMVEDRAGVYKFKTSKESQEFKDFVHQYLQDAAEKNQFINPAVSMEQFKKMSGVTGSDRQFALLMGILNSMPREQMIALSSEIMEARRDRDRNTHKVNQELRDQGLIAAFAEFLDPDLESMISSAVTKSSSGADVNKIMQEHKVKSRKLTGVGATNEMLSDILSTLRKGIITYTYHMGFGGNVKNERLKEVLAEVEGNATRQLKQDTDIKDRRNRPERYEREREAEEKKRAHERRFELPENMRDMVLPDGDISDMFASEIQASASVIELGADADNPVVQRHRDLLDGKLTDMRSTIENSTLGASGSSTIKAVMRTLRRVSKQPLQLFDQGMKLMDGFMFKALFGEDMSMELGERGEPYLLKILTKSLQTHFTNAKNWFAEHIGNPFKKALFDKDDGLLPQIGKKMKDIAEPHVSRMKDKGKDVLGKFRGTKQEDGTYTGGRFSDQVNSMIGIKDKTKGNLFDTLSGAISKLMYGDYADTKGVGGSMYGVDQDGTTRAYGDKKYGGVIGKLKMGFDRLNFTLFGKDDADTGRPTESRQRWNQIKGEFGKAFPDMTIGAGLGAGAGLITSLWLPGGPLFGALIGSGLGFIKGSENFKEYLFGKEVIDEKTGKPTREGKLISREVYEGFKKFAPKIGIGALLGGLAGGLGILPFGMGPILGTVFGSIGGMSAASDQIKKLIFGDGEDPKTGLFSKEFRGKIIDKVKQYGPPGIGGAAAGGILGNFLGAGLGLIPGLSLLPTGPIFSFLGAAMGIANADKIKEMLFGEETETTDENGKVKKKREGGLFGNIFNKTRDKIIEPFAKKFDEVGHKIGDWFQSDIIKPLSNSIKPLQEQMKRAGNSILDAFKNIGSHITDSLAKMFHIDIGEGLGKFFKDKVLKKLDNMVSKMFNAIGKVIGGIISAPFKALEFMVAGTVGGKDKDQRDEERYQKNKEKRRERAKKRKEKRKDRKATRGMNMVQRFFYYMNKEDDDDYLFKDNDKDEDYPSYKDKDDDGGYGDLLSGYLDDLESGGSGFGPGMADIASGGKDKKGKKYKDKKDKDKADRERIKAERDKKQKDNERAKQENRDRLDEANRSKKDKSKGDKGSKDKSKKDKDRDTDESSNRPRLRKRKSDNDYLADIAKYTKKIHSEIKGQLGGLGWNIAYIKAMMDRDSDNGPLSTDDMPDEMEGSTRNVKKRRGFLGRQWDRVKDFGSGMFDRVKDSKVGRIAKGVVGAGKNAIDFISHPIEFMLNIGTVLKDAVLDLAGGVKNILGTLMSGVKELVSVGWGLFKDTLATVGNFAKGIATGVGKVLGNVLNGLTGVLSESAIMMFSLMRGLVESAAEVMPDVVHIGWKAIKGAGRFLGRTAKAGGRLAADKLGQAKDWMKGKITGKKPEGTPLERKMKNIGTFEISGGKLDTLVDPIQIAVGGHGAPIMFPIASLVRGRVIEQVRHVIPVYLAAADPSAKVTVTSTSTNTGPQAIDDEFVRSYENTDRVAERSPDPAQAYDRAIGKAKTRNEVEAIALAQQMNANGSVIHAGNAAGLASTEDSGFKLSDLLGGLPTAAKAVVTALGGAGIGALISKGATAIGTGASALGSTVMKNIPFVAATLKAIQEGDTSRVVTNVARQATGKGAKWLSRSAVGALDNITAPGGASTTAAAKGVGAKLITFLRNGITKLLNSKVVKNVVQKIAKIDTGRLAQKILVKFDDVLLKLGSEAAQQLLKKANLIVMGATAIFDFGKGMAKAAEVFKVSSGDTTLGMRFCSGLATAVSGLAFGLIPVSWLAEMMWSLVASKEREAELKEQQAKLKAEKEANGGESTVEEASDGVIAENEEKKSKGLFGTIKDFVSNLFGKKDSTADSTSVSTSTSIGAEYKGGKGPGWGKGRVKQYAQTSSKFNQGSKEMAQAGCGPTVAAMVGSAYGDRRSPMDANNLSYGLGMRAGDGGTNPEFFSQYADTFGKGYGMKQGPTNSALIEGSLAKGQPVALMGKGGAFGNNDHYLVADRLMGKGKVRYVDPYTGGAKIGALGELTSKTNSTIYSYGKGYGRGLSTPFDAAQAEIDRKAAEEAAAKAPAATSDEQLEINKQIAGMLEASPTERVQNGTNGTVTPGDVVASTASGSATLQSEKERIAEENKKAQQALVDKMASIQGSITYSLSGPQNPDKGSASCASTVGWAYNKVLGLSGMSASSSAQSKDDRFSTIWTNSGSGDVPLDDMLPGDIVYTNWSRTSYNKNANPVMNHTEMYSGENFDWSHGGPKSGPVKKELDSYRKKHIMMVRRYTPFLNGESVTYNDDGTTSVAGGDGTTTTTSTNSEQLSVFGKLSTIIGTISNMLGASKEDQSKMLQEMNASLTGTTVSTDATSAAAGGAAIGATTTADGSTNKEKIWNFLHMKGLNDVQAAGIMGNWMKESGLQPGNVENKFEKTYGSDKIYTQNVDNTKLWPEGKKWKTYAEWAADYNNKSKKIDKVGYGLAQWTFPTRKEQLLNYAQQMGTSVADPNTQLNMMWDEINANYAGTLENIKKATTTDEVASHFLGGYEMNKKYLTDKNGRKDLAKRQQFAKEILNELQGTYKPSTATSTTEESEDGKGRRWGKGAVGNSTAQSGYNAYSKSNVAKSTSANASSNIGYLTSLIRSITNQIMKARTSAEQESIAEAVTSKVTQAITNVNTTSTDTKVVEVLSASLSTMIQLLSTIAENTAKAAENTTPTESDVPTTRADNYNANLNGPNNQDDVGAAVVDKLTSK